MARATAICQVQLAVSAALEHANSVICPVNKCTVSQAVLLAMVPWCVVAALVPYGAYRQADLPNINHSNFQSGQTTLCLVYTLML